jgi:hypothetical protein
MHLEEAVRCFWWLFINLGLPVTHHNVLRFSQLLKVGAIRKDDTYPLCVSNQVSSLRFGLFLLFHL